MLPEYRQDLEYALAQLCHKNPEDRDSLRARIIRHLTVTQYDTGQQLIGYLLDYCVTQGGPHGLDEAMDILATVPSQVTTYVKMRMLDRLSTAKSSQFADSWYVVARSLAQSELARMPQTFALICAGLVGSWRVCDGSLIALQDLGGSLARQVIELFVSAEDRYNRETAQAILALWENE